MNLMLPRPGFWALTAREMKTRFSMLGELLILMLLHVIASFASSLLLSIPMAAWVMGSGGSSFLDVMYEGGSIQIALSALLDTMPDWMMIVALFASVAMGIAALVYCRKFQRRSLASMGLARGGTGEYLLGLAVGLILFGAVLAVGVAAGGFRLAAERPAGVLGLTALALLGCAVQGASAELLFNAYFAASLGARYPAVFALLMSSLARVMLQSGFAVFSMGGLNALLLALFLGIWVIKRGSLWSACAIQGAWSFASGFLFQCTPEGQHSGIRLLDVDVDFFRPLLTGGEGGPQSSICATVILLAAVGAVLALKPRDPAPDQTPPSHEQAGNNL